MASSSGSNPGIMGQVTTTVEVESNHFTWKIQNFPLVQQNPVLLAAQVFTVTTGKTLRVPCTWIFFLDVIPNPSGPIHIPANQVVTHIIRLNRQLVHLPAGIRHIYSHCTLELNDKLDKEVPFILQTNSCFDVQVGGETATLPFMYKSPPMNGVFEELASNDEKNCFRMQITLKIFGLKEPSTSFTQMMGDSWNSFQIGRKWREDMAALQAKEETHDVTLISKDEKVITGNRVILAARSPVFEAMFRANMQENKEGVIEIKDLSYCTLKVLMTYFYSGKLLVEEWSKPEVIVELTYAAGKYHLTDVLEILDHNLGKRCDTTTVGPLLDLASKLGLKQAEKELFLVLKRNFMEAKKYSDFKELFGNE